MTQTQTENDDATPTKRNKDYSELGRSETQVRTIMVSADNATQVTDSKKEAQGENSRH